VSAQRPVDRGACSRCSCRQSRSRRASTPQVEKLLRAAMSFLAAQISATRVE
jgi:hypothetical protein